MFVILACIPQNHVTCCPHRNTHIFRFPATQHFKNWLHYFYSTFLYDCMLHKTNLPAVHVIVFISRLVQSYSISYFHFAMRLNTVDKLYLIDRHCFLAPHVLFSNFPFLFHAYSFLFHRSATSFLYRFDSFRCVKKRKHLLFTSQLEKMHISSFHQAQYTIATFTSRSLKEMMTTMVLVKIWWRISLSNGFSLAFSSTVLCV